MMAAKTGTTQSGFSFSIPEENLDNMELLDALADLNENDPLQISHICRLLLGKDQRRALYDHLRTPAGNVPVKAVSEAIGEIFHACGDAGKN